MQDNRTQADQQAQKEDGQKSSVQKDGHVPIRTSRRKRADQSRSDVIREDELHEVYAG